MADDAAGGEAVIAAIKSAAGIVLTASEERNRIEIFFEGDLMHTRTVGLLAGGLSNVYVEATPHKTTFYEHPRVKTVLHGPNDLRIARDGDDKNLTGVAPVVNEGSV